MAKKIEYPAVSIEHMTPAAPASTLTGAKKRLLAGAVVTKNAVDFPKCAPVS